MCLNWTAIFYIHANTEQSFLIVTLVRFLCLDLVQSFHICKFWDIVIVLMLGFKVKDKIRGSIAVCMVLGLESLRTAAVDYLPMFAWALSHGFYSVLLVTRHGFVTPLIRQSMISLEREKMWRENHSVMLKDCIVFTSAPPRHLMPKDQVSTRRYLLLRLSRLWLFYYFFFLSLIFLPLCLHGDRLRWLDQLCLRVWEKLVFYAPLWRRDRPVLCLRVDVCRWAWLCVKAYP